MIDLIIKLRHQSVFNIGGVQTQISYITIRDFINYAKPAPHYQLVLRLSGTTHDQTTIFLT